MMGATYGRPHHFLRKQRYTEDESGRVTVTVVNQGSKSVDSSKLTLKLGDFFTQTKTTGMIAAGSATQVTFDFVAPETLERMTVTATATTDPNNEITESNENNNTLTSTLAVKPIPPDLAIIATNAQNWYAGKEVVVTATVVNYTKRAVPEVTVRLTLGSSRYEEIIPMPGNGSNLAVFRIKLPAATGSASLAFMVDPYNAVPEGNESNNDLSKTVQIVAVPVGIVLDPDLPELEQTYKTRGLLSIPNATNSDYLSLGGISEKQATLPMALSQYLKDNPGIRHIRLMLDNDKAGRSAAKHIAEGVAESYDVKAIFPCHGKDLNDEAQWMAERGPRQPAPDRTTR